MGAYQDLPGSGRSGVPTRGGTLPRNVRVVWARLDSGTVAVGTRGTTAGLGPIARLAERHRCFGKLSVLSLGEAGEWLFRDFKNRLYGTFEALFLIWQAYLMSAMIIPEFVLSPPMFCAFLSLLLSRWSRAHWCWYSWYWCASCGASITCFLENWSTASLAMRVSGCHASSRIRFTVRSRCSLLFGRFVWWAAACLLPRNVRVVWARLDSGSVAVGTRGTTASQGPIARFVWRHRCFGKLSVLSLGGEAGERMFRDFKNRLYGTFEALFLIWQAYLMSAMIIPEFVLSPPMFCAFLSLLPSRWSRAHWCWYSWYWCASCGASITCFLESWSTASLAMRVSGCHASSRIRFTVRSRCSLLFGRFVWWAAAFASEISGFSSKFLCAVVLLHFEKAGLALEGIRQFHVAVEIEERKLNTFCDLHETRRVGSSGFPVCWSRFGLRAHSRYLGMVAQGTLISLPESSMAKNLVSVGRIRIEEFKLGCLDSCCVNVKG